MSAKPAFQIPERPLTFSEKLSLAIETEGWFTFVVAGLFCVGGLVVFVKWVWNHF